MHGLHITACLLALAAAAGCGDDAPKTTISDDTSWQVYCARSGGRCQRSLGAHTSDEDSDIKIEVSCSRSETGLTVTLNDPGDPAVDSRGASTLKIQRLDPTRNQCTVILDESTLFGRFQLSGACGSGSEAACQVTGKLDSDGWSFDGELSCDGLSESRVRDTFGLGAALGDSVTPEPMVLKIANCK